MSEAVSRFASLLQLSDKMLLSRETIEDDQATRLADGWEIIVGVLGSLEKEHRSTNNSRGG